MPRGKVLLACGRGLQVDQLTEQLSGRGFEVVLAGTGQEVVETALAHRPDVIVLDQDAPGINGPQACREIRRASVVPIVLLGSGAEETDLVRALGCGADHYLVKPAKVAELVAHIEAAARRETVYNGRRADHDTLEVKDLTLDIPAHELRRNGAIIPLSITEFKLVQALARNAGRVLTRDQLLDCVWDCKAGGLYSRTVDVHIARIRRKMGDSAINQQYIMTVPGLGYKMVAG